MTDYNDRVDANRRGGPPIWPNPQEDRPMAQLGPHEVSPEQFFESTGSRIPLDLFQQITGIGGEEPMDGFGFLEMSVLGHALVAYAENPTAYLEQTETTE